jgi:hypothetical protein
MIELPKVEDLIMVHNKEKSWRKASFFLFID